MTFTVHHTSPAVAAPHEPEDWDVDALPMIDQAAAGTGLLPPMPAQLYKQYFRAQLMRRGMQNRFTVAILIIIFDGFWLAQFKSAPELVPLSGLLRFLLVTPLGAAFVMLDRRSCLGRCYDPLLVTIAGACGVVTAILCVRTTSLTTLADIRSTTLILLSTGLTLRLTPCALLTNVLICGSAFVISISFCPVVPQAELPSLILNELANGSLSIGFGLMLERRDRLLFLLRLSDHIRRSALATQNLGLTRENQTDSLTRCGNRRSFDATLGETWSQCKRQGVMLGLIMIDIDHFKRFNDHYGHQGGDDCLVKVAAAVQAQVRKGDLLARYGGEEFAVLMAGAPLPVVAAAAERIRAAVANIALPHEGVGPGATVSLSLGAAAIVPKDDDGSARLVEQADQRLYKAKTAGRNRVVFDDGPRELAPPPISASVPDYAPSPVVRAA